MDVDEIVATDIEESLRRVRSFRETHEEFNEEPIQEPQIQLISDSLVLRGTDSLTLFDSAAFEYFQSRNFKGLEESGEEDNEIRMGQFGIAASYVQIVDPGTKDIEDL